VPDDLLNSALDPQACLRARSDVGGASPVEVRRQIALLADALTRHEAWLASTRERQTAAEDRLLAEARANAGSAK
jgi:argininosuccinate lyase